MQELGSFAVLGAEVRVGRMLPTSSFRFAARRLAREPDRSPVIRAASCRGLRLTTSVFCPAPSKRAGTPFQARQREVSLSRRSKPQLACSKPVSLGLLQEWLRTAALAKRTRDGSS